MKLKAVATRTLPESLLQALDSSAVADAFRDQVAVFLHVNLSDFGPATHYVQETNRSIPTSDGKWGIEITLSKVSVNDYRAPWDFRKALEAVQNIYVRLVEAHLYEGEEIQLFSCLALDREIEFVGQKPTTLLELSPVVVKGKKQRETGALWFSTKAPVEDSILASEAGIHKP